MCCSGECVKDGRFGKVCAVSNTDIVEVVEGVGDGKEPAKDEEKPPAKEKGKDNGEEETREFWSRWVIDDDLNRRRKQ